MTRQQDHVVLKCSDPACGMRYPSPADDPRRDSCPLCESEVSVVGEYGEPPLPEPEQGSVVLQLVGVLDSIRSAQNVGMMIRSADGAALDHLYLTGLTAPADNPKVLKTSLGAEQSVATTSQLDVTTCIAELRTQGFEIWAIEFCVDSIPLEAIAELPPRLAFVVGNERAGIDPSILKEADRRVHLEMLGTKSTLNVGVAFGIAAYSLRVVGKRRA